MSRELYNYKRSAKKIAKELFYHPSVIARIDKANTTTEISRILKTARTEEE